MPSPAVALLRTQSDDRLAALAASGHERAFEAIVERHRRPLLRHARRYLPDARAEDAVQQALLSAWTGLRRGDDVRELRAWLHRIVHNAALNALRAAGYDYETLAGDAGPADAAERRAVVRGTLTGLAALPERQRAALLQIAVEGRSQDEVAAELGLSTGAVRQLVHRARTTLRAAATALCPLPLVTWLAGGGRGDVGARIGELVAGAGGGATLAKASAVAVLAGGAVAGPAVVHQPRERAARPAPAPDSRAEARRAAPRPAGVLVDAGTSSSTTRVTAHVPAGDGASRRRDDAGDDREHEHRQREDDGRNEEPQRVDDDRQRDRHGDHDRQGDRPLGDDDREGDDRDDGGTDPDAQRFEDDDAGHDGHDERRRPREPDRATAPSDGSDDAEPPAESDAGQTSGSTDDHESGDDASSSGSTESD